MKGVLSRLLVHVVWYHFNNQCYVNGEALMSGHSTWESLQNLPQQPSSQSTFFSNFQLCWYSWTLHTQSDQQQPWLTALSTVSLQLLRQAESRTECSKLLIVYLRCHWNRKCKLIPQISSEKQEFVSKKILKQLELESTSAQRNKYSYTLFFTS